MTKKYNVFDFDIDKFEGKMTKSEIIRFLRRRLSEGFRTNISIEDDVD
mgnify:CR=1 FL=1